MERIEPRAAGRDTRDFDWLDDRVDVLKSRHAAGDSAAQIAKALGGGLSRSAVLGKIHRLGLSRDNHLGTQVQRRFMGVPASRLAHWSAKPVSARKDIAEPTARLLDGGVPITVLTVAADDCRWPHGDVGEAGFHFCGHAKMPGRPYCEFHARKAVVAPQAMIRRVDAEREANKTFLRMFGGGRI